MGKFLLLTLGTILMLPISAYGETVACTPTPNCESLGYKETSCPNGEGVRCPWGNKWACLPEKQEVCDIGSILYSDKSCSQGLYPNKTPIGVVVYIDGKGVAQALSLQEAGDWCQWSNGLSSSLPSISEEDVSTDSDSCKNTEIILSDGDNRDYPAAWLAHKYSTEGTSAGDWCLPAVGVFVSYYNNRELIDLVLDMAGGFGLGNSSRFYWSSSKHLSNSVWGTRFDTSTGLSFSLVTNKRYVRPVIEFQISK